MTDRLDKLLILRDQLNDQILTMRDEMELIFLELAKTEQEIIENRWHNLKTEVKWDGKKLVMRDISR